MTWKQGQRLAPADAVRLKSTLIDWTQTEHYLRAQVGIMFDIWATAHPQEWPQASLDERINLVRNELAPASMLREADLVYADAPMCDMVAAAAHTFPEQHVYPSEFLAPSGTVVFAKQHIYPAVRPGSDEQVESPLSAITWLTTDEGISILTWSLTKPGIYTARGIDHYCPGIHPHSEQQVPWGNPAPSGLHPVSALRSLCALSRQPLACADHPKIPQSVARIARRAGVRTENFRRISLRRPENAAYELAAARTAAAGRAPAGHWVRGYWRRPYNSAPDARRSVWIEGFPRGDFTRPGPQGDKLLIARGDRPAA
ncbi:hypothetical protein ABZ502_17115 [Streptomyces abikoensis]|uniref:hypothetical protein n=1 Tax=Streptomyces abikoensis TaxID=97398 RepID=UPI0033FBC26B